MIKAVVFDFDGMVHHTNGLFSINTAKKYGIGEDIISEFFRKEFQQCLIGKADLKEKLEPYLKKWDFPADIDKFLKMWFKFGEFDQNMIHLINELREKGIKCILVTNNEQYRIEYYKQYNDLNNVFDKIIASYQVGSKKPDKEMIDFVLDYLKLEPNEILFCDDKQETLNKAKEYGFKIHKYHNITEFKKILENELS